MRNIKDIHLYLRAAIIGFILLFLIIMVKDLLVYKYFIYGCGGSFWFSIQIGCLLAILLGMTLTGYVAAYLFEKKGEKVMDSTDIGIYTGVLTGFFLSLLITGFPPDSTILSFNELNEKFQFVITTPISIPMNFLFHVIVALPILILFAGFGGLGGFLFARVRNYLTNTTPDLKIQRGNKDPTLNMFIILSVGIFLCLVFPAVVNLGLIMTGVEGNYLGKCIGSPEFSVTPSRSDETSVNLVLLGNYSGYESQELKAKFSPSQIPLQIIIDGKDLSNQSIVLQQGLSDTITPPEGITRYINGTSILLSGPDVRQNGTVGRHLIVTCYYANPYLYPRVILDTYV
jgi:hypothetical protein